MYYGGYIYRQTISRGVRSKHEAQGIPAKPWTTPLQANVDHSSHSTHGGVCPQHPLCDDLLGLAGRYGNDGKDDDDDDDDVLATGGCVCVCILVGKERKAGHD